MRHSAKIYAEYLAFARSAVADPALGVIFMHVPVPHPPYPYNRVTGRFDGVNRPRPGYANSLALLDRVIQTLREEMEQAGTWSNTAVLFSSDHPFRESKRVDGKSDPRVPFLLRMPGSQEGKVYTAAFNTIISGELLMSVLRGTIRTNHDVTAWIDEHRSCTQEPLQTRRGQ
jgi:arylsulfatase A-like enzyme